MIQASGTITAPFTCTDSTGAPTTPTGTPTYTLVKNGTDTATTGNCSGSAAQWYASATVPSDAEIGDRFWFKVSAVISSVTYTVNTAVQTVGVFQTGDSFAQIGSAGAGLTAIGDSRIGNLDATVSSRLASGSYTAPPSSSTIAGQVRTELTTELARIDAAISTRAATGAAMTLTSGERTTLAGVIETGFLDDLTGGAFLAGVQGQIEALFDSGADVPIVTIAGAVATAVADAILSNPSYKLVTNASGQVTISNTIPTPPAASTIATQVRTELTTELGRIDAAVSSRLDASGARTALGLASANLDTQLGDLPTAAENATAVWAADTRTLTSSGGIGAEEIQDIVDGIADALTTPGFAASVSIQEGTYATVADVEARLSAYGVTNLADLIDPDGTRDSQELGLVEVAIEYANSVIDEHIVDLLHNSAHRIQTTFTRPSGNAWLRDRCVDIACYRIATLGGRSPSDVLRFDYDSALDRLAKARNQQIRIPHLQYTAPTRPYAMEMGGKPTVVRTRGT